MKKLSPLKLIFLAHLILISIYFYNKIYLDSKDKDLTSHTAPLDQTTATTNEIRPIGVDISNAQEAQPLQLEKTSLDDNIDYQNSTIEELISRFGINHVTKSEGLSILMLIIQDNRNDLFFKYLDEFKNIDHQNIYKASALVMATSSDDFEFAKALLSKGANPNIQFNKRNFTILMDAAMEGNAPLVSLLIEHKAHIDIQDNTGKTALIFAAIEGHSEVIKILLNKGAQKNLRDEKNLSALDYLVIHKHAHLYDLFK